MTTVVEGSVLRVPGRGHIDTEARRARVECVRTLTDLRGRYPSVLDDLVAARPSTLVATIPVDAAQRVDDVARVLRELVGIR